MPAQLDANVTIVNRYRDPTDKNVHNNYQNQYIIIYTKNKHNDVIKNLSDILRYCWKIINCRRNCLSDTKNLHISRNDLINNFVIVAMVKILIVRY